MELLQQPVIGSRVGPMRELLGFSCEFDPRRGHFIRNERRNVDPHYAAAETIWYLQGSKCTKMIKQFAPKYHMFEDKEDEANGAYGARISKQHDNLLLKAFYDLKDGPDNNRRTVVPIFQARDLAANSKDVPCTCNLKFYLREEGLTMVTDMRSNDVWLGFPYDTFAFCNIGFMMAKYLEVDFVRYVHQAGSMHLYEKNRKAAEEAISQTRFPGIESLYWFDALSGGCLLYTSPSPRD